MKLRRKLISAGFALGASALTLTTSTFAWYTANNEVNVNSVSGATSAQSDSTSLYIAAAKTYASTTGIASTHSGALVADTTTYSTIQTPVLVNAALGDSRVLTPVAYTGANTYEALTGSTANYAAAETQPTSSTFASGEYYISNGVAQNPEYTRATAWADGTTYYVRTDDTPTYSEDTNAGFVYEYVLRFQRPNATAETPVYVSAFSLTNSAEATDFEQQALAYDATNPGSVGINASGAYSVDMLHALKMTVAVTGLTAEGAYPNSPTTTRTVYDLDGYANTSKDSSNMHTTVNAVGYYNAVLGTNLVTPATYLAASTAEATNTHIDAVKAIKTVASTDASTDVSNLFTIPSTGFVEVRFTFWLDGWDTFCYDACKSQNFEVSMSFSTSAEKSVLATHTPATGKTAAQSNEQSNG